MANTFIDDQLSIDFGDNLNEDDDASPNTWPAIGSAKLIIKDNHEPLFISATWTLVASVNDLVISKLTSTDAAHTAAFITRWTQHVIRSKYEKLRRLGVDAETEYVKLGGNIQDLEG